MGDDDTNELLDLMEMREFLIQLKEEHRDLDEAIHQISANPYSDQLRLKRMKKRKLLLKDEIKKIESGLIPDIDA